ncbi:MAG: HD domain-containing protein [Candidatus Omnitrophica bacterium]|nr:HD domain-containing protein [Candidatus Omnitrophota bacterium]
MPKSKMPPRAKESSTTTSRNSALDFFAEAGLLKRVKRSGWWVAGIEDPESVADHCFRCAVIGFYMAHEEGADPYRVLAMTLFNDIHEARINDLHKMGHYYIDFKAAEKRVFADQVAALPARVKSELVSVRGDYDTQASLEALVARDADILECLVQAKEYCDNGHPVARKFLKRAPGFLKTRTAKELWEALQTWDSTVWWENVVKFER